jgi:hypothetical protein
LSRKWRPARVVLNGQAIYAVAKSANLRSLRLLERLGFSAAAEDLSAAYQLEPGEALFVRRMPLS